MTPPPGSLLWVSPHDPAWRTATPAAHHAVLSLHGRGAVVLRAHPALGGRVPAWPPRPGPDGFPEAQPSGKLRQCRVFSFYTHCPSHRAECALLPAPALEPGPRRSTDV